ncbi:MAG: 3-dehydroquinate synthase [Firmicutes bacterium]|nr:3-dehydroquinate synthase [Bacillota bacterium]
MEKRLRVELGERSYDIVTGTGLLEQAGRLLRERGLAGKTLVVTNTTVARFYLDPLVASIKKAGFETAALILPDGEEYKTLAQVEKVYNAAVKERLERSSVMVALGGGVIGDLTGFAASSYLRGVHFVQVPTTLLAQVDSSVGGKVGVNHREGKNLIGAFYQPAVVITDLLTLKTLAEREFRAGLAEVIKHALILDPGLYHFLSSCVQEVKNQEPAVLEEVILKACAVKLRVVEEDEREQGLRAILNYGHTIGHALEAESGYGVFRHGEAVAIGMAVASLISETLGFCPAGIHGETVAILQRYGLPVTIPREYTAQALYRRMLLDKKVQQKKVRFVLPQRIGEVFITEDVPETVVIDALRRSGAG